MIFSTIPVMSTYQKQNEISTPASEHDGRLAERFRCSGGYLWTKTHATSLGIMVNKGNHPQMALIQVSEIL